MYWIEKIYITRGKPKKNEKGTQIHWDKSNPKKKKKKVLILERGIEKGNWPKNRESVSVPDLSSHTIVDFTIDIFIFNALNNTKKRDVLGWHIYSHPAY